jgi:hypothetical protein
MMFMFGNFSGDPSEPFSFPIAECFHCNCTQADYESNPGMQQVFAWLAIYKERLVAKGDPFKVKICHWGGTRNKSIHVVFIVSLSESQPLNEGQRDILTETSIELDNVYKTCFINDDYVIDNE